jgi:nicotinamide-nucleotide amidase
MDADLLALSEQIGLALREHSLTLSTAESCTGGWAAQVVTHTSGSSAWFDRGFVTYSNQAKADMLGVAPEILVRHGAVSLETAAAMAAGALKHSNALISLSITGIAGPTGGSPGKPVGTVCFGWCRSGEQPVTERCLFPGNREEIRRRAVIHALTGTLALVGAKTVP